ncbi:MAG: nucleotidyltransferase domain-containing protein [Desulfohalobiaceae bacterium]
MRYTRDNIARAREERRKRLEQELDRLVKLLAARRDVHRVILFGSLASGNVGKRSDLDLVIISDSERSFFDRLQEFLEYLRPRVSIDLLVYTPREWEVVSCERRLGQHIAARGKVLYEAAA